MILWGARGPAAVRQVVTFCAWKPPPNYRDAVFVAGPSSRQHVGLAPIPCRAAAAPACSNAENWEPLELGLAPSKLLGLPLLGSGACWDLAPVPDQGG
ncbi:unnamed protein product [Arctogadus glacialis]